MSERPATVVEFTRYSTRDPVVGPRWQRGHLTADVLRGVSDELYDFQRECGATLGQGFDVIEAFLYAAEGRLQMVARFLEVVPRVSRL